MITTERLGRHTANSRLLPAPRGRRGPVPGHARDGWGPVEVSEPTAVDRNSSSRQAPLPRPTSVAALPAGTRSAVRVGDRGSYPASLRAQLGNTVCRGSRPPTRVRRRSGRGGRGASEVEPGTRRREKPGPRTWGAVGAEKPGSSARRPPAARTA